MLAAKRQGLKVCSGEVNLGRLKAGWRRRLGRVVYKWGSGHGAEIVCGSARDTRLVMMRLAGGWMKIQLGTEYKLIVYHYYYKNVIRKA
jgi:uncharacterized membrane protein